MSEQEELKQYAMQLMDDSTTLSSVDTKTVKKNELLKNLRSEIE